MKSACPITWASNPASHTEIQTLPTADVDEMGFLANELIQDAVIRNIEVIGEAANNIQRVDAEFANAHSEIPFQVMYAMRNRLSHGYDRIDLEMVWKTVCNDLPYLYKLVKAALT
jgi:uncharacterized protein with HEPN domain